MAITLTSFDGYDGGEGRLYLPNGDPAARGIALAEEAARNLPPAVRSVNYQPLQFPVRISIDATSSQSEYEAFCEDTEAAFRPWVATPRTLLATWHDGTTAMQLDCWVVSLEQEVDSGPGGAVMYRAILRAAIPFWVAPTLTTTLANEASIVNDGTTRAYPRLSLTSSTHVSWHSATVTDNTGRGLVEYPVAFGGTFTGASASTLFVLVNGVSVPTLLVGTTKVWARVSVPPNGTTQVDIIYGTGLSNEQGGTLSLGGLDPTNSTNATWRWTDFTFSDDPLGPGMWRPGFAKFAKGEPDDWGYETNNESASGLTFQLANPSAGQKNDANAIILNVGTAAGASNALSGLSRVTTDHTSGVRSFVRVRTYGSANWAQVWAQTADGTVTTDIDVDGAVEIAIGTEYTGAGGTDDAAMAIAASGNFELDLDGSSIPTVSVASATNMDKYDGTITNSTTGQVLTFNDFCVPDGTLIIDCSADPTERVISHADGPSIGGITFSDSSGMLGLDPGPNALAYSGVGSVVVIYRDSYV